MSTADAKQIYCHKKIIYILINSSWNKTYYGLYVNRRIFCSTFHVIIIIIIIISVPPGRFQHSAKIVWTHADRTADKFAFQQIFRIISGKLNSNKKKKKWI